MNLFEAYKPKKLVRNMNEDELAEHKVKVAKAKVDGQKWNRRNPVMIKNVVDHWNAATDDEKKAGENWYADAHNLAHHIANDTGHDHGTVAGLVSLYSPQTHWAQNIHTAARVARTREALGGEGSGVLATKTQKKNAQRILDGEHHSSVIKGPKTSAFAHLIEHGGSADEDNDPKVVIDRHALSVAAGARATDNAYAESRLGTKGRYHQVSQVYHKAARKISKQEGRTIHAHQVQAATWLARQRMNEEDDRTNSATSSSSATTSAQGAIAKWNDYAAEHHPGLLGKEPGTGYARAVSPDEPEDVQHAAEMASEGRTITKATSLEDGMERTAYGETKAPAEVDTLRDEACPICSESASYDGNQCQVCGYVAPPAPFQDPDVDVAKSVNLRQDANEAMGGDGEVDTDVGQDQDPLDPNALADPDVNADEQQEQDALDPNALNGEDAQINVDVHTLDGAPGEPQVAPVDQQDQIGRTSPELEQNYMREGQPFEPGPNAPTPEDPMEPLDPASDDLEQEEGGGVLGCPACGLTVPAAHPVSEGDATDVSTDDGQGMASGTPCPNCGKAALVPAGTV